ncbi:MAG: protein-export chaperone SecB [Elusimicrobiota bacterium]|jgi:hypothetical protein|nr:protein-export chaperone SecB [Elusimicrobiota bacterium]
MQEDRTNSLMSPIQMAGYKINQFLCQYKAKESVITLNLRGTEVWHYKLEPIKPTYFIQAKKFYSGVRLSLALFPEDTNKNNMQSSNADISLNCSIIGIFVISKTADFEKERNEILTNIRSQTPYILFPYLRAAISAFFATSGAGAFMFPLMDFRNLKDFSEPLKEDDLEIIDESKLSTPQTQETTPNQ